MKHVAHARFTRNHRLINEIFSEAVVPDARSVVNTGRVQVKYSFLSLQSIESNDFLSIIQQVLKRQVQSLTMHQKRLESELTQIEEKYHQKKSKFVETSEEFQQELKRHCSRPAVDEEKYQQMVKEQVEKIRKEREERVKAAAAAAEAAAQQQQANSEAKPGKRKATFSFMNL